MAKMIGAIALIFGIFLSGCEEQRKPLFTKIPVARSGVHFKNSIVESDRNYFNYIYNGGGVAIGDINNDGLPDIYFTANELPNKLYLNKGDFKFEDITDNAGVAGGEDWENGVVMVDVNQDGLLDIYVCRGGWKNTRESLRNYLYINQGDLTFEEKTTQFGLEEVAFTTHASFFDYDNDNDLDVYIANRPDTFFIPVETVVESRKSGNQRNKDKLYRNDNGFYTDVSAEAGIANNFGYALSVVTSDVNNDGHTDIYVANDFVENDYLYMNKGDGTFEERIKEATNHISFFSMGSDIADINNDGYEDIFVTEMLPKDYKRSKTTMASMNRKGYQNILDYGVHPQYMHNVLQLNRGNGFFSEIANISNVAKTDWSWSVLVNDFNNDGWNDIFISNGIKRDILDRDAHLKKRTVQQDSSKPKSGKPHLWEFFPQNKLSNYMFENNGDLTFSDKTKQWGMDLPSFSNGAAYGDLDNDGDLDLVINNVGGEAFIYRNDLVASPNYLKLRLRGPKGNRNGLGAKITVSTGNRTQYQEFKTVRGYLSSVEPLVYFGLGDTKKIERLTVQWPDGKTSILDNITANRQIEIDYNKALNKKETLKRKENPVFAEVTNVWFDTPFKHQENSFDDYAEQVLLPQKYSTLGPFITVADMNNDGLDDFYIGGASGQPGQIYVQQADQKFKVLYQNAFAEDQLFEDMGCTFLDADNDGDQDLYVVSGGYEFEPNSKNYQDRLYLNDGHGNFRKSEGLPEIDSSGSCVQAADFDNDGDLDLLVGGRVVPEYYPFPPVTILLQNDGKGNFENVTKLSAPGLSKIGMVTSAVWNDVDGDDDLDLLVVGEWMPITLFVNNGGVLEKSGEIKGLEHSSGWWNTIVPKDLDNDGDTDFIVGNLGENHKFRASMEHPFHVYANDFDMNGKFDVFLAKYYKNKQVPVRGLDCSSEQIPQLRQKFKSFEKFANADINEVLGQGIDFGLHLKAELFSSIVLENNDGSFKTTILPEHAQLSTLQGVIAHDFNHNGQMDILLAGNQFDTEIETSPADASCGLLLQKSIDGTYKTLAPKASGFFVPYNVKDIKTIRLGQGNERSGVLVAANNDTLRLFRMN